MALFGFLFISDGKFTVCDMGQLDDLIKAFNKMLEEDPYARGDAARLNKRILLLTCHRAEMAAEVLRRVPEGL